MSATEMKLGIVTVLVLIGFLIAKHLQRVYRRARRLEKTEFVHSSFDPTLIQPRVQRLRQNYEAALKPQGELQTVYHLSLLASFREAVSHSAYFHEREAHE